jgi:hypothetical protein
MTNFQALKGFGDKPLGAARMRTQVGRTAAANPSIACNPTLQG